MIISLDIDKQLCYCGHRLR